MNCLSRLSSYAAVFLGKTTQFVAKAALHSHNHNPLLKSCFVSTSVRTVNFELASVKFQVRCFSSSQKVVTKKTTRKRKLDSVSSAMEQESGDFYVVRKGDIVGVYKTLSECQAQVGNSICDPPVSVYKGSSLSKDMVEYLVSRGLKNSLYTIHAANLKEDLFGNLVPCPFQQPSSSTGETPKVDLTKKRSHAMLGTQTEIHGSTSGLLDPFRKHAKLDAKVDAQSCILEFDGASKGNPGPAGAGAVLRNGDGRLICRLREGLGKTTNNVAEYRAMLLGLKYALKKGFTSIRVQGDSKLICSQIQGVWKVKHQNLTGIYEQAKQLKNKFTSFEITHVLRELNSEADAQANLAINLEDGQVQEEEL